MCAGVAMGIQLRARKATLMVCRCSWSWRVRSSQYIEMNIPLSPTLCLGLRPLRMARRVT